MSTPRTSVSLALSAVALLFTSTSFGQEPDPQSMTIAPAPTPPPAPPPQQTQPVQTVTVQPQTQTAPPPPLVTQPVVQPVVQQPVATTTTTSAPYAVPVPGSDRYTERTVSRRPHRALLSIGTGSFLLTYGASVVAGAVSDRDADRRLFVPVVGPWMDLAARDCGTANPCGDSEDLAKAMIVTSGVMQGAGVLMALSSLFIPETSSVEERTQVAKPAKPTITVAPVSFAAGGGVGALGRF